MNIFDACSYYKNAMAYFPNNGVNNLTY